MKNRENTRGKKPTRWAQLKIIVILINNWMLPSIQATITQRWSQQWTALRLEVFWQTGVSKTTFELEKLGRCFFEEPVFCFLIWPIRPALGCYPGTEWPNLLQKVSPSPAVTIHIDSFTFHYIFNQLSLFITIHHFRRFNNSCESYQNINKQQNDKKYPKKVMMAAAPPGLDQVFFRLSN